MTFAGTLLKAGIETDGSDYIFKGNILASNFMGTQGITYYVDGANGAATYNGKSPDRAFNTLTVGEAGLTANQNDTLVYLQSATSQSIATKITWDKNYTHLLGVCAPTNVAQRARIFNSGSTGNTPLIDFSASGCIVKDLYFFQGSTAADTKCVTVSGNRNYFENVHFAGMGHGTSAADIPACSLFLTGSENYFKNCSIGLDTIVRSAANGELVLDGSATRNTFENCLIYSASETAGKFLVKLYDTNAVDRFLIFKSCIFYNFSVNHGATLAAAFSVEANSQTHDIIIKDCMLVGVDEWEANDRGQMWINMGVGVAEIGGVAVEPVLT